MRAGFTFYCFFIIQSLYAEINMPSVFGDHMVLQRNTDVAIWGKAGKNITVNLNTSWNKKVYTIRSDYDGYWKTKVTTPDAGGPFTISISDGTDTLRLEDILIGEVWVCSGQSNMAMPMRGFKNQPVNGSHKAIVVSENMDIRLFKVQTEISERPQENFEGDWKLCEPGSVNNFSATAYYFGKLLHQVLGIPIGLIVSSVGGTRIEPWMDAQAIDKFGFVKDNEKDGIYGNRKPSYLYNAMINPMVGFGISGVIWYQGESNSKQPNQYQQLLPGLIQGWRDQWNIGDFGFYYVQIAPFEYRHGVNSAYIRDAMRKVSLQDIPNIGMACLMDVGEKYNVHPPDKKLAGERLAYIALAKTYGISGVEYSGPVLKEMLVEGSNVRLIFDHAKNGLTTYGKPLEHFEIAGKDRRYFRAKGMITKDGVLLESERVTEPVAVRYAFENFVVGEIFNTEGLPASSFRTDDWDE